jgi:putative restriction endonuclease
MPESYTDTQIRNAAFTHVQQLMATRDQLTSDDLYGGFPFEGERVPLINQRRGIFKPQRMQYLLSIRTVYPKAGGKIWYDDQRQVHDQIYRGDETVEYAFMGQDRSKETAYDVNGQGTGQRELRERQACARATACNGPALAADR